MNSSKRTERLYGAYAAVSWSSSNQFQQDAQAFLFRFECPKASKESVAPEKFVRTDEGGEVFDHTSMGLSVWIYRHDFFTFDGPDDILREETNDDVSSFALEGLLIDAVRKTEDKWRLEVLHVGSIDPAAGELDSAWQNGVSWSPEDGKKLQDRVLSFDPRAKRLPVDNINILLCGGVGAGKSSFVSTIDSLCEGRTSRLAPHGTGTGSLTCKLRKYTFTDPETDQLVHWKLWDSMGWGMNDYKQGELNYILDGKLPDGLLLKSGLIEATLLVLQHSLDWSWEALQLLHAVQPYIKPVHRQLVVRLHGIKLITAFLHPPLHTKEEHAVVKAEELGPYPDSAWPDAGQKMSCLNTIMVAAEVMTGTLRDASSQSSAGPTTFSASQQRRGAKSKQSSTLFPAAEERVQAGIAALAALEYTLYQTDLLDYDVMTDILFKLVHDLLLPHQDLLKADVVKMGPSLWLALDNLLDGMTNSAGSVQNNPFSLYVVYSLLAHEQLGMWILSDIGRTLQMHSHLLELMDELCQDGPLETAWLSAACVTKTWHCEFVSYPKEAEEGRKIVNGFGRVHECLLDVLQDPGPWNAAECIAAIRLLNAVSADHIETEATQARDGLDLRLHFLDRAKSLTSTVALQHALVGCATIRLQKMMPFFEANDSTLAAEMQLLDQSQRWLQQHAKRAELEKVVRVVFACHRAAWGQAGFSGGSPSENIAKLVYVLLYDSVASLVHGALARKHGRHLMVRRRRQLATASSKEELAASTVKYKESCRLYELHDDAIEERQDYGMLAQLACELRMHSAWKANFDAVQFANTKLDSDVLSNMGSHLSYLQEWKALPEATLDQISECFMCPKKKAMEVSAEMAAEQLLAEEAADQARAVAKKAKKQHAAAQPSLDQNSQLAGPSRHKAAQATDDKALFNLFCCPLKAAMHDPVIAADGHTYERHAMEHRLLQHGTSPITRAQLNLRFCRNGEVNAIEAYASLATFKAMKSALVTAEQSGFLPKVS
ncbi:hypothetical protein WJX82_010154 [Trebouxia sp. C0006]